MERPPIEQIPRTSCWDISIGRGEPLIGTAPRVDIWFLLTYSGPMGAKAFLESKISGEAKDYFNHLLGSIPHSRLLLIKPQSQEDTYRLHVVVGREADPFAMSFELDRYEDAVDLDIPGALTDETIYAEKIHRQPFFSVCTNGNRDPCCARLGLQTFRAFREFAPKRIWQSSHVGGHRFAANVLSFPHGIYYGRVGPEDVPKVIEAGDRGEIRLENYRGRACHDPVVQAADLHLRQQTGQTPLAAYRWTNTTQRNSDTWEVRFAGAEEGIVHTISIARKVSEDVAFVSCRSDKKEPMVTYEMVSYQTKERLAIP
jgi:hypothetical protein